MFHYIEYGILRYDFVYEIDMYLFQVLPLLLWTFEFSKTKIVMYFGHRFPLTSHIMSVHKMTIRIELAKTL